MSTTLPTGFIERMKKMLPDTWEEWLNAYEGEPFKALRVNVLKEPVEYFTKQSTFSLTPVLWEKNGFYYQADDKPGKHPYHEAGVYYMQEPSAMAVGALAGVKPGEYVLDLCAAPGGKSTQIASALQGEGLLVANEIHPARAKILSQNIERMGVRNCIVTNETPEKLSQRFAGFFQRIIVDAPCSGEGMFRKEEQALEHWSLENIELCASRQQDILTAAERMLAPGGVLVYSTCTFAPEEDEGSILKFLMANPSFHVCTPEIPSAAHFDAGDLSYLFAMTGTSPEFAALTNEEQEHLTEEISRTIRLFPHHVKGEGHFLAILQKEGKCLPGMAEDKIAQVPSKELSLWKTFAKENLQRIPEGVPVLFGEELYLMPAAISLKGLKVLRPGLHVGTMKKNRFEPSHSLALSMHPDEVKNVVTYQASDVEVMKFLKGETLSVNPEWKGYVWVSVDGYLIGYGKAAGGVLKNHYPKGLRIQMG